MPALTVASLVLKKDESLHTLLERCAALSFSGPLAIHRYHDLLLFALAYPADEQMRLLAQAELNRLAAFLEKVTKGRNQRLQRALSGAAMAHTELIGAYSLSLTQWLAKRCPGEVTLESGEADPETVRNTLQALLPGIEYQHSTQGELTLTIRLRLLCGSSDAAKQLNWLLQLFDQWSASGLVKEESWRQLKIFIRWRLASPDFSRTGAGLPVRKIHYHPGISRGADCRKLVMQRLGKPLPLNKAQTQHLHDVMKASLAFQHRETDPVTYADSSETTLFDMGRGLQIAVCGMTRDRRLSLESYIGFMAFKNGVPVSYGGGWLWGRRCKIGVNIYPPFRRGESAWLFSQVMRVYYQHYGARYFTVKPYQFGKGNPEGLASGAFWFYYKLGFRPEQAPIRELAAAEWENILTEKSYRTPLTTLRHFTRSNLEWTQTGNAVPSFDASLISQAITRMINQQFAGSREEAITQLSRRFRKTCKLALPRKKDPVTASVINNWSLLTGLLPDLAKWKTPEKKQLARLVQLKATGKERDYVLAQQQQHRLWLSLTAAVK